MSSRQSVLAGRLRIDRGYALARISPGVLRPELTYICRFFGLHCLRRATVSGEIFSGNLTFCSESAWLTDRIGRRSCCQGTRTAPLQNQRAMTGALGRNTWPGLVTRTLARIRLSGKMAHDDLVCPPSIFACDHPARRLAVRPFHAQLSRRRDLLAERGVDFSYETVRRWVLIRTVVRPTSPSTPAANIALASR